MSRRILQPRIEACQLCDFMIAKEFPARQTFRQQKILSSARQLSTSRRLFAQSARNLGGKGFEVARGFQTAISAKHQRIPGTHTTQVELEEALQEVKAECNALLELERTPSEQETVQTLDKCNTLVKLLVYEPPTPSPDKKDGAASALLSLDDSTSKKIPLNKLPPTFQRMIDELSNIAYSVIRHPPIFIASEALELYVSIQASLGKPKTFPEVFHLYANKPLPQQGSAPIRYKKQNPNKVANAVPVSIANRALQTAIDANQLVTAMDIIETSYTTKAFHRAKFVRKGLLPATGLAVAPVAAYTMASQFALLQTTMDAQLATNVAFAGILAYVGFTATIGIVAVTTANDQMDRVTWAQGIPLRERWVREEERAAIDKVAGSWGFREVWRRGEEEGEDWDTLREWIGRKGMMLDRVELMEGME